MLSKMSRRFIVLFSICFLLGPYSVFAEARVLINRETGKSSFKPTKEWKPVPAGQAIPPGLHVRFNLSSNLVEAKEMDSDTGNDPRTGIVHVPSDDLNIKNSDYKLKKFRDYEELKKSLKEWKVEAKSELAVMIDLVKKAKTILNAGNKFAEKELVNVLTDLNDCVEQIDVGREFAKIRGMEEVIIPGLNKSAEVKSSVLLVLGSALQNNQPVQIAAYKAGLLKMLLALIASEKDQVLARAMFSLSALVRRLPIAQKGMVDSGGAGLLIEVFNAHEPRIQGKILALLYDLLMEQRDANLTLEEAANNVSSDVGREELKLAIEKQNQYQSIKFAERLVEQGWCSRLADYLKQIQGERRKIHKDDECPNISQPEHDKVEKAINAMLALKENCAEEYQARKEMPCTVTLLSNQYEALKRCENEDESEQDKEVAHYYGSLAERLKRLADVVGKGQPIQCKDEL